MGIALHVVAHTRAQWYGVCEVHVLPLRRNINVSVLSLHLILISVILILNVKLCVILNLIRVDMATPSHSTSATVDAPRHVGVHITNVRSDLNLAVVVMEGCELEHRFPQALRELGVHQHLHLFIGICMLLPLFPLYLFALHALCSHKLLLASLQLFLCVHVAFGRVPDTLAIDIVAFRFSRVTTAPASADVTHAVAVVERVEA